MGEWDPGFPVIPVISIQPIEIRVKSWTLVKFSGRSDVNKGVMSFPDFRGGIHTCNLNRP